MLVSNSARMQRPQQRGNQRRQDEPKRQFTKINMLLSQALQHMLKMNMITLIEPHLNLKTSSPNYNLDARCAYHSSSPEHDTNDCWVLNYKIQNFIVTKEIEFDPLETLNVITAPMPNH